MEIRTTSTTETEELAKQIAEKVGPSDIIALYGDLGSGKTTFTKFLIKYLGITSTVQSPTFVIAREYRDTNAKVKKVNHLDLYRIENLEEAKNLDLEEYLEDENAVTVIEWPGVIEEHLPKHTIRIRFDYSGDEGEERIINVQNLS